METMNMMNLLQAIAVVFSAMIAIIAYKKNALDFSGALTTFIVSSIHFAAGFRFGMMLMCFFLASYTMKIVGAETKRRIYADYKEQSNWAYVLSHTAIGTILVVILWLNGGKDQCLDMDESPFTTALLAAIIGHYSSSCGDICASMAGLIHDGKEQPHLITTFKRVRKGTHGGVTVRGTVSAHIGGAAVGLAFLIFGILTGISCASYNAHINQLIAVAALSGLGGMCGSLIDSFLGATLQYSGYCLIRKRIVGQPGGSVRRISGRNILSNDAVDFVSILLTTLLTSYIWTRMQLLDTVVPPLDIRIS